MRKFNSLRAILNGGVLLYYIPEGLFELASKLKIIIIDSIPHLLVEGATFLYCLRHNNLTRYVGAGISRP